MRILLWHGWLLEGSGSNIITARTAEVFRAAGHDVLLLCQQVNTEPYPWIDAHGSVDPHGPSELVHNGSASSAPGRCVLLRPRIGEILPVFVLDRYEGFGDVRRFVDLTDRELESYLSANVEAVRAAVSWHETDVAFVGHAIPGAVIGRRALGPGRYVAKIHGSDLEYAVRPQNRYRELAREGLEAAHAVVGASAEALERCAVLVPEMNGLGRVIPPGVDIASFRPRSRVEALLETADRLDSDLDGARGRSSSADAQVEAALGRRDAQALDALADSYDQEAPDLDAAARLRRLAGREGPIVGYLGKLIPPKGVELLLAAHGALARDVNVLVVGFGSSRERLAALSIALRQRDRPALEWLRQRYGMAIDPEVLRRSSGGERDGRSSDDPHTTFTGRLDHRFAPGALAAMDVLVVPSILHEAFGMVTAEGAAAGALPLVARHSGLAEVAAILEEEVRRPGLFSFEPGEGAVGRLVEGIDRLLSLPAAERDRLRAGISAFVTREWTWERTAARLLEAAGSSSSPPDPQAPGT